MPRITADFSKVSDEGGAIHIPEGLYKLKVSSAKVGRAKGGDHQPVVSVSLGITGPSQRGKIITRVFSLQPQAMFSLRNMLLALGYPVPKKKVTLDTDAWKGRECGGYVIDNNYERQGQKRVSSQVDNFITLAEYEAAQTPAASVDSDLDDALDAADDLDDDETETEDTEDDEDEDQIDLDDL